MSHEMQTDRLSWIRSFGQQAIPLFKRAEAKV